MPIVPIASPVAQGIDEAGDWSVGVPSNFIVEPVPTPVLPRTKYFHLRGADGYCYIIDTRLHCGIMPTSDRKSVV